MTQGTIRTGIGGWTFEPWENGQFYPEKLAKKRQLLGGTFSRLGGHFAITLESLMDYFWDVLGVA